MTARAVGLKPRRSPGPAPAPAPPVEQPTESQTSAIVTLGALTLALIAAYWESLGSTAEQWSKDLYSHGYVVPFFTILLLWMRRKPIRWDSRQWGRWVGLGVFGLGLGMWSWGTYKTISSVEFVSFVPSIIGIFMIVGGWPLIRWAGAPLAFLVFMFPLPSPIINLLLTKLQGIATGASTFVLQTLGIGAQQTGFQINLGEGIQPLEVVAACSGMRMLTILVALAFAIALIIERPWWERLVIILSAIPIAIATNVIRITATGLLYMSLDIQRELYIPLYGTESVHQIIHDWAGFAMMPIAMGLLYLEVQILSRLIVEEEATRGAAPAAARASHLPRQPR